MKFLSLILINFSIYGAYSAVLNQARANYCQPPNGRGLYVVLEDFTNNIPVHESFAIITNALRNDPEVKAIMAYAETIEYQEDLDEIRNSPEYQKLLEFACQKLYLRITPQYNDIRTSNFAESKSLIARARPGYNGFLLDLYDIMPFDKLEKLFDEQYADDEYLRESVENLKSQELKDILKSIENLPKTQRILANLRKIGVNIAEVKQTVLKFLNYILKN